MPRQVTARLKSGSFIRRSLCFTLSLVHLLLPELTASRNVQASIYRSPLARSLPQQTQQNTGAQSAQEVSVIEPGKPIERELAGGQSHSYQITLTEGQFLEVIVEQRGIDVVVRLLGPDGKQIAEFDSEIRRQGQETVSQVAEIAGSYRLNVQASQQGAPAGRYEIRVVELRAATEKDRALQEARKLSAEVVRLYRAGKYDEARPLAERALEIREKALGPEHPRGGCQEFCVNGLFHVTPC